MNVHLDAMQLPVSFIVEIYEYGYFHLRHIDSVKMYAKRRKELVLISCKRIVISPENPEEFVAELESRIK
ncbi:MAG: hypothetical protein DRO98_02625 [Archaeoglobales archaeon]|nr:MAG: hypothetical protein DRO98_02625 [Archaeoglobales archaeon]